MKKVAIFLCLFFLVLSLYARAIQEDYSEAEEIAKVSYAFGMAIGSNFNLQSIGIKFDYDALADGLRAMVEQDSQPQFSEQEAMEIIETALQQAAERRASEHKKLEEEFLAVNSKRAGVHVTRSGLQYEIIEDKKGEKPTEKSVVRVKYTSTFIDGKPFDSSTEEEGAFIPLEMVLPGWAEGFMLMSPGSHYRFYIPSDLAYGSDGIQGIIPPYSTLIFTVMMLEIINSEEGQEF